MTLHAELLALASGLEAVAPFLDEYPSVQRRQRELAEEARRIASELERAIRRLDP